MFNKIEEGLSWKEAHLRTCNYHVQLEKSNSYKHTWCMLPSKDPTEFKKIKGCTLLPEHSSETGKFKGFLEIKKEIDAVEKHLPYKVKKNGLNPNSPKKKRKASVR